MGHFLSSSHIPRCIKMTNFTHRPRPRHENPSHRAHGVSAGQSIYCGERGSVGRAQEDWRAQLCIGAQAGWPPAAPSQALQGGLRNGQLIKKLFEKPVCPYPRLLGERMQLYLDITLELALQKYLGGTKQTRGFMLSSAHVSFPILPLVRGGILDGTEQIRHIKQGCLNYKNVQSPTEIDKGFGGKWIFPRDIASNNPDVPG